VKIFRSSSTLYFANVELYAETLKKKVGEPPAPQCSPPAGTGVVEGGLGTQHCVVLQSGINVDRLIEKKKKAIKKLKKQQKKAEKEKAKRKKVLPCCGDPSGATPHRLPARSWPSRRAFTRLGGPWGSRFRLGPAGETRHWGRSGTRRHTQGRWGKPGR